MTTRRQGAAAEVAERGCAYVTTSRRGSAADEAAARSVARRLGAPFVPRTGPLRLEEGPVLVAAARGLRIETRAGSLFFHPGMAQPRLRALRRGRRDVMVEAMGLEAGMSVLDGTLGLGADAIVASWIVGPQGRVVGLEAVAALAEVVRQGMARYEAPQKDVVEAVRRVEAVHGDHREFLAAQRDGAFDVVYFDPLFEDPVVGTVHMRPWRELGRRAPLTRETLEEARRVAARRVVVKERRHSSLFARLGIERVVGGKSSRVAYGLLEAKK